MEGGEYLTLAEVRKVRVAIDYEDEQPVSNAVPARRSLAWLPFSIHHHMLRRAKGFQLAQSGTDMRAIQGYLGHRDIKSTVIYAELDPSRFKGFGKDI